MKVVDSDEEPTSDLNVGVSEKIDKLRKLKKNN